MPEDMMTSLVESFKLKKSARRTLASFTTSLLLQLLAAAVLILAPLMATDTLPMPRDIAPNMAMHTLKVAPPPRPVTPGPQRAEVSTPVPILSGMLVAPMEIPDDIGEDIDFFEPVAQPPIGPADVLGGLIRNQDVVADAPVVQEPVRTGGDIEPPQRTVYVAPVYTEAARRARMQGLVILEAVIDSEGYVTHVKVLRSVPLLDRAAIEAVKQWKYEPTLLNGVPVPIVMTLTVRFVLQ